MPYKLFLEGQEIPLSDEIAATDDNLRGAIAPYFPEVGTAEIVRQEKNGITEIRLIKRAGTKGNNALQSLMASETEVNPALELTWQLKQLERQGNLSIETLISLQDQIDNAVKTGEDWERTITDSLKVLSKCSLIPAQFPIIGI